MSTKTIRMLVEIMVEIESDLPVAEAIEEFEQDCQYNFPDTSNVKTIRTEWRETERVSYTEVNKTGIQLLIKPLKNEPKQIGDTANS